MAPAAPVIEERPLRRPDTTSPAFMTRRGWWLVVMNFLVPGSAQVLAGNRRLGRVGLRATLCLWALAIIAVVSAVLWREPVLTALSTPWIMLVFEVVAVAYVVLWAVLTLDTLRLVRLVKTGRRARIGLTVTSVALLVLSGGTGAYAAHMTDAARNAVGSIFRATGADVGPTDGYYNILLLGGDDGQGRDSLRFDSISIVSVDAQTGRVVMTGVPRDLEGFPFVDGSPMKKIYPDLAGSHDSPTCGWTAAINQLNTELQVCRDGAKIYPDAAKNDSTPGIEATKDAVEGLTGVHISYYAFIDMGSFAALVDALGGVTITSTERLPEGGGPSYPGETVDQWATGWILPGTQHMNGATAEWYARSRKTTSDWDRMKRQRQLEQAILKQFTPTVVLSRFDKIAKAGEGLVKTDIPSSMLGSFADLALKSARQPVTTVELTPASGVDQFHPDIAAVRTMVHSAMHPSASSPAPRG